MGIGIIQKLENILDNTIKSVENDSVFNTVIQGTADVDTYIYFLSQTYHYVLHTTDTLHTVAKNLEGSTNPLYQQLHQRFIDHEEEEEGHPEWALNDISAIEGNPEKVKRETPNPAVQAYNKDSHFFATSQNPISIFGEAYILEGVSERLASKAAKNLISYSKIPNIENAVTFLSAHGETDIGHMDELRKILTSITDEKDKKAIVDCAAIVGRQYRHLMHYY